ncbi:MAG: hypothetical protein ABI615_13980, partial [Chthoniobacterales bacterium]
MKSFIRRMKFLLRILPILVWAVLLAPRPACGEDIEADSRAYMKEELGVNEYTAPSIAWLLKNLDLFRPIPMEVVDRSHWDDVFSNRLQT